MTNKVSLPDCALEDQKGDYATTYDSSFTQARDRVGIPFGLLKAHAIRESSLDSKAFRQEPSGKASYGLMQILWWKNSSRFSKYGYSDDTIGDGSFLYDPDVNAFIAANIIKDNLKSFGNLRDAVNAYNTGKSEAKYAAPGNYVNDVLGYYSEIIGRSVT